MNTVCLPTTSKRTTVWLMAKEISCFISVCTYKCEIPSCNLECLCTHFFWYYWDMARKRGPNGSRQVCRGTKWTGVSDPGVTQCHSQGALSRLSSPGRGPEQVPGAGEDPETPMAWTCFEPIISRWITWLKNWAGSILSFNPKAICFSKQLE